ncbi:calcium:proton antiporter [Histophilus somni]|uniref:calcium:proton antiporter n=1 Tax=Histophilus somni TaxID=731 RepID=UPI00094B5C63|nr:ionic transporter y4hA [Histophilus somni]
MEPSYQEQNNCTETIKINEVKKLWLDSKFSLNLPVWTLLLPLFALLVLAFHLLTHPTGWLINTVTTVLLIGSVFAAVHYAEVIAHKVGEPFGTLVLAIAVTVIEVALIVILMSNSTQENSLVLARDTVYAALMLICNGIVGIGLLIGGMKNYVQLFSLHGIKAAVSVLLAISLIVFVLPNFTLSAEGGGMVNSQLLFVAMCCLVLYGSFIFTQTIRHRNYFVDEDENESHHNDNWLTIGVSIVFLLISLVSVVGLAKMLSPTIESALISFGLPKIMLGIIVAGLVLLPESIASIKAAYNNQLQNSLNLGLGSALASIALTVPVIAIISVISGQPIVFGLTAKESLMLIITLLLTMNTLSTGRSNFLLGVIHLVMLATFIFFSIIP